MSNAAIRPRSRFIHKLCALRALALPWLVLLAASAAYADSVSWRVEIDAPPDLRKLLEENLRIVTRRKESALSFEQLKRLHEQTPAEIEALLATEGYFSPKVEPSLEDRNPWLSRFKVTPGPPARVKQVRIDFQGAITGTGEANEALRRKVRQAWYLDQPTIFRQADWDIAKRIVLQVLLAERFPAARISDSEARIDAGANSAELSVTLDSGPAFAFGELEISGLERYDRSVVQRQNRLQTGTPYSLAPLQDLQQRLQDTGYFASVLVGVDTDTPTPERAPVRVALVEARSRRLAFGVGFSTDTKGRVSMEYSDVNILGRGWRLKSVLRLEQLKQEASAEVAFPRTAGGYDPRVFAAYELEDIQGTENRKWGFGGAIGETRGNIDRSVSLQYAYEDQTLSGAPGSVRQAVFGNFSWTQRAVDNLIAPTRGYLVNLQAGGAPAILPNSRSFVRGYGRGAYYLPLGKFATLLARAELGYVESVTSDDIPSTFLFRTGGDTSVRGYPFEGIGVVKGSSVVGGRVLGVASLEYTQWLTKEWGAAVFTDAGDATDHLSDFEPKYGYGLGARWRSPVGSLNLDLAYGQQRNEYRMHFTVGVAF